MRAMRQKIQVSGAQSRSCSRRRHLPYTKALLPLRSTCSHDLPSRETVLDGVFSQGKLRVAKKVPRTHSYATTPAAFSPSETKDFQEPGGPSEPAVRGSARLRRCGFRRRRPGRFSKEGHRGSRPHRPRPTRTAAPAQAGESGFPRSSRQWSRFRAPWRA